MKLELVNFKCYTHKIFNIPDGSMVLLQGNNGTGKTTVIQGIIYALYGAVKQPCKWTSETKQKTYAKLETEEMIIKRTHKPCTLKIKLKIKKKYTSDVSPEQRTQSRKASQIYEEDAAQEIINATYMNKWEFLASSLFFHTGYKNMIDLTSQQRIEFIWKLEGSDITAKSHSTKLKTALKGITSNIPVLKDRLRICEDKLKVISDKLPENIREIYASFEDDVDELKTRVQAKYNDVENLKKEIETKKTVLKKYKKQTDEVSSIADEIEKLTDSLSVMKKYDNSAACEETENNIVMLQKAIKHIKLCLEKQSLMQKKDECEKNIIRFKEEHTKNIEDELAKLSKGKGGECDLENLYDAKQKLLEKYEAQQENVGEYEKNKALKEESMTKIKHITLMSKKKFGFQLEKVVSVPKLKTFLMAKKNELLSEVSHHIFMRTMCETSVQCPQCETQLSFSETKNLVVFKNPAKKKIKALDKKINDIQNYLSDISSYIAEIELHEKNINIKLTDVKKISYDEIKNMEASILNNKKITELKTKINEDSAYVTELQNLVSDISAKLSEDKFSSLKLKKKNYAKELCAKEQELGGTLEAKKSSEQKEKDIEDVQQTIKVLRQKKKSITLPEDCKNLDTEISDLEKQRNALLSELSVETSVLNNHIITQTLCKKYTKRSSLKKELIEIKKQIQSDEEKILRIAKLISIVKQSKVEYVEHFIETLNKCCEVYFEPLFNSSTSFYLKREESKLKLCISHKGEEEVSIKSLSGGEVQKCKLIFLLSLNTMFDSPYLLMDEFLHSTDEDKSVEILHYLKENFCQKTILCSLHKCVTGVFHHIINVGE
ncbi:MAG TPA: hypothetical protein VLE02_02000 [Nitrosarchaeum sp.]|nr:hypothetical protein [Nitrosarchaeum sp.]